MRTGTQVFSSSSYRDALNEMGDRKDGPHVLAISAASVPSLAARTARREGSWHRHHRGQVVCVEEGLVRLRSELGSWIAPPNRAIWIPPGIWHSAVTNAVTRSWNLYLSPTVCRRLPLEPCILEINRLIDAIVDRALLWTQRGSAEAADRRLMAVLVDELHSVPRTSTQLPMPRDRRLKRIAEALLDDPASVRSRNDWASWAGLSSRTLSRLFQQEVHMSFSHWRDQALLMAAIEQLGQGQSVSTVADALGYSGPSSFIAMFRRHFGVSPRRYMEAAKMALGSERISSA